MTSSVPSKQAASPARDSPSALLTTLAHLEAQLAQVRADLDRSQQLATLGTIAAMAIHDINNQLTPILTYAQLAQANPADQVLVAKTLERTVSGVQHASKIATTMLHLASPGSLPLRSGCEVGKALEAAIACLPRGTRPVELTTNVPVGIRAAIDPTALQQLLLNLLLNAFRAVEQQVNANQAPAVTVTALLAESSITLEVSDNGAGVDSCLVPDLFTPFASSSAGGSGLGLAICARLVEQVGGKIWLDESYRRGARFCIQLPRAAANTKAAA